MLRHVIAPRRAFSQIPHAITRNRRLGSHAKNLLNWQLSLPADAHENLSDTAQAAGLRKSAFQEGKRELLGEGFLHQWKVRTERGTIATVQLVSNVPLTAEEAAAVRDGRRPAPGLARTIRDTGEPPTATPPAVGEPTVRAAGRLPEKNTRENTSPPTAPRPEPAPAAPDGPAPDGPGDAAAEALLRSLVHREPRLALSARKAREWAPLAAPWITCGLPLEQVRRLLTEGLTGARSPLGALRWRLANALPDVPPPPVPRPRPEPRVARMRECRTRHDQPRLFTPPPGSDEDRCWDCRTGPGEPDGRETDEPEAPDGTGFAAFRAARRSHCPSPRAARRTTQAA
ncbi:hypothetical protein [Streptomyces sp. TR06-5]|uniref:hypothetical protein n=1 Tax=unclassified Streptomyces TaxID=2593676 RepID=UPI0039A1FCB9